jgi:hypothetical protein
MRQGGQESVGSWQLAINGHAWFSLRDSFYTEQELFDTLTTANCQLPRTLTNLVSTTHTHLA